MIVESIKNIDDFKKIKKEDLSILTDEIRTLILNKTSKVGGHVGPNLGDIELTVALHYVFDSPKDKLIFDVSHQTYCHKIITGRSYAFIEENNYNKVTGFSNRKESEHDLFDLGHTSTSISLGLGMAKGRDLNNEHYNVVSIIGDGSLTGGEALEALNNVYNLKSNFIIIVNDNNMSISENHGGLYENLRLLRETKGCYKNNYFKTLELDYAYLEEGNDVYKLIEFLNKYKDIDHPIVLHIKTTKGYGYKFASEKKENFHYSQPFDLKTGELLNKVDENKSISEITFKFLSNKMLKDKNVIGITAATPYLLGFNKERREKFKDKFVDVGICEQHSIGFLSGLSKAKAKGYLGIYASFIQRAYDQVSQDFCLNDGKGTILIFGASIFSKNNMTHLGIFDISLLSNIPNLLYLDPTNIDEYLDMLEFSYQNDKYPIAIRVPINYIKRNDYSKIDYSLINKNYIYNKGEKVALISVGNLFELAIEVYNELKNQNYNITLVKPIFLNSIDEDTLYNLSKTHDTFITIEDSILDGGYGQKVASYLSQFDKKVINLGLNKEFIDGSDAENILKKAGIEKDILIDIIKQNYKK